MTGSPPTRPKLTRRNAVWKIPAVTCIVAAKPSNEDSLISWAAIVERYQVDMSLSIYCSNAIENVGGSLCITNRLCKAVFAGDVPYIDHIDKHDIDYPGEIAMLEATGRGTDRLSIIRSRREVVQHAVAMKFLFGLLVVENHPLDEAIIKYTHQLLMMLSEHEDTGGVYRNTEEAASHGLRPETDIEFQQRIKDTKRLKPNRPPPERTMKPIFFSKIFRPPSVPIYMEKLVREYERDIERTETRNQIAAIELASKYCNFLVCIHPFEDGNGRMCRLLMNAILLKYAGAVVAIGRDAHERNKYIEQAVKANKEFTKQEYDDVSWDQQTSHRGLGITILQNVTALGRSKPPDQIRS